MKKILAVLLVTMMVLGMVSLAANAEEKKTYKAAFISQSLSTECMAYSWKQFQKYAVDYGFEMTVFDSQSNVQNDVEAIGACIAQGFDAIFITPNDINAVVPSLMEAKEAGIIVGMFSSDLAEENWQYRDFYCGVNDTMAGQTSAKAFIDQFPDGATIVEVGGQAGHDAQIKRHDGFMEGIKDSKITLLDTQNCAGWATAECMAIAEDFIVKYGDRIQGVFCHWDNGATGVIEALKNAGMKDVYVVAVDGCGTGYDQVKAGTQACSIGQSFVNMAIKTLECGKALLDGGTCEPVNYIPLDIVTAENVNTLPYPEW